MVKKEIESNFCVICGAPIPEGIMVCPNCEQDITEADINNDDK